MPIMPNAARLVRNEAMTVVGSVALGVGLLAWLEQQQRISVKAQRAALPGASRARRLSVLVSRIRHRPGRLSKRSRPSLLGLHRFCFGCNRLVFPLP